MIQELLGGSASTLGGERKLSLSGTLLEGSTSSSPSSSSPTTTAATATTSTTDQQNLRCPRCDSSNTKFCYYNNYNLTQPRHFCKTCRRYWTKGGALRNVPIGGGCRKNKNTSASTTAGKSNIGKVKTPSDIVRSSLGFDHEPASNPILWASSPQNSQLLTLLRATQNPNPNHISNSVGIKGEGNMIGSHMISDSAVVTGAFNARPISLDPLSQVPIGLCSSFWRNNQHQPQQHQQHQHHHHHHHHHQQQQQQHQHNLLMGEPQNSGIQDLYQRLRTSSNYYTDHSQTVLSNVASTSSSSSAILEPNTIAGGEMGYWNPAFSWPNLPTTNGAFP